MHSVSIARRLAFRILRDVDKGAFAADLLHELTASIESRDAALCTELVLGCLRRRGQLDHLIKHFARRDPEKLGSDVRRALYLGIYQLRYLDRIPPHAAVNESVELLRHGQHSAATGLVNAVLRKVNRDPVEWPDRFTALSMPPWLLRNWEQAFGAETAEVIAAACLIPPETYIRVPAGREAEALALGAEPTIVPGCFRLLGESPGSFRIQDIGSQCVVPLLDLQPGQHFLDLCAGSGGKTAQALETPVVAIAADRTMDRLIQAPGARVLLDATEPLPFSRKFDRILVDAPCSGTGTLRGNPEIRWRIQWKDLREYQQRQARLVRTAIEWLAPGGRLVYSTCSLERQENQLVIEEILRTCPALHIIQEMTRLPGRGPGDGFYAAVLTSQ